MKSGQWFRYVCSSWRNGNQKMWRYCSISKLNSFIDVALVTLMIPNTQNETMIAGSNDALSKWVRRVSKSILLLKKKLTNATGISDGKILSNFNQVRCLTSLKPEEPTTLSGRHQVKDLCPRTDWNFYITLAIHFSCNVIETLHWEAVAIYHVHVAQNFSHTNLTITFLMYNWNLWGRCDGSKTFQLSHSSYRSDHKCQAYSCNVNTHPL